MARRLQNSLLASRIFLLVMVACGILELLMAIQHPSARFLVPRYLPFDHLPFLSARAATLTSSLIDLGVLVICALFVADSRAVAERTYWLGISWIIFLPVIRYFLPFAAVWLWWTGLLATVFVIAASGVFLVRARHQASNT